MIWFVTGDGLSEVQYPRSITVEGAALLIEAIENWLDTDPEYFIERSPECGWTKP